MANSMRQNRYIYNKQNCNNYAQCQCPKPAMPCGATPAPYNPSIDGKFSVAMGYVPWQHFKDTYEADAALCNGTLFPELCKEFCGKGGCCR